MRREDICNRVEGRRSRSQRKWLLEAPSRMSASLLSRSHILMLQTRRTVSTATVLGDRLFLCVYVHLFSLFLPFSLSHPPCLCLLSFSSVSVFCVFLCLSLSVFPSQAVHSSLLLSVICLPSSAFLSLLLSLFFYYKDLYMTLTCCGPDCCY